MWAWSRSERPPPVPRTLPTTLNRPGATASSAASTPLAPSQLATKRASRDSAAPPAESRGFRDSIETRSRMSRLSSLSGTMAPSRGRLVGGDELHQVLPRAPRSVRPIEDRARQVDGLAVDLEVREPEPGG